MSRFSIDLVILGLASWAFCFLPLGLSGFLLFHEAGSSLCRTFWKICQEYLENLLIIFPLEYGGRDKKEEQKERKFGLKEFPRPLYRGTGGILCFIEQYNLTAKPFKWAYKGVPLTT